MATFPQYEHYKGSNSPWLGKVPKHWDLLPGLAVVKENKEKNKGMVEETVLSLSYGKVIVKPPEKLTGLVPESFETYQVINPGDIIIRPTDLQNDTTSLRTGLAKDRGIITSAYLCLRPAGNANPKYLHYLLHAYDLMKVFYGLGSGLRQNLDYRDFKRLEFALPPSEEQDRIVNFLDQKTAEIDEAIAKKQRLIELLKEQKAILINLAVTKGLDSNAPMRDSGVEWVGEIPTRWVIKKIRWICFSVRDGTHNPPPALDGEYRLLSVRNIVDGEFVTRDDDRAMSAAAFNVLQRSYHLEEGDVVVALVGGTTGKSAVVRIDCSKISVQRSIGILRPIRSQVLPEFLNYAIQAPYTQMRIWGIAGKYAAQPGIYLDDLAKMRILCPPIGEQRAIVSHLSDLDRQFQEAFGLITQEIQLLVDHKASLISSAVTGQIQI